MDDAMTLAFIWVALVGAGAYLESLAHKVTAWRICMLLLGMVGGTAGLLAPR